MWAPTRFTPSLSGTEDFVTDGDYLIWVVENFWQEEDVEGQFHLDEWQRWLIRHALERYPDDWPVEELRGRLRFRQLVISMGRQNGKSILGAIFGVYGLLFHEYAPRVVGLAYSEKTAKVIYQRVSYTLNNVKQFKSKVKVTKTSGITRRDTPGEYIVKPASEKAIQGFPISMCIYDEIHITPPKLWDAVKKGIQTKKDGQIIGITTAGDDNAELLKSLYKQGDDAIANPDDQDLQRFGFFVWEAPEGSTIDDDEAIKAANPAVACGRVDLANVRSDAKTSPETEQQRYTLNRFVANSNSWIDLSVWNKCAGKGLTLEDKKKHQVTYGIDASSSMEYVSIVASAKVDGKVKTRTVASLVRPTKESLLDLCLRLRAQGNCRFVLDPFSSVKWLGEELKKRNLPAFVLSTNEMNEACSTAYRLIIRQDVEFRNDPIIKGQVPGGVRKNFGDQWRISRAHSSIEIDALLATVFSMYITDRKEEEVFHIV